MNIRRQKIKNQINSIKKKLLSATDSWAFESILDLAEMLYDEFDRYFSDHQKEYERLDQKIKKAFDEMEKINEQLRRVSKKAGQAARQANSGMGSFRK